MSTKSADRSDKKGEAEENRGGRMRSAVQLLLIWLAVCVSSETSIAAEPWALWMKTEMFTLDAAEKKTSVGTFWRPAGSTKESSGFDSKIQCESRRDYTISQFRAAPA